jgi:hypothetical protein
VSLRALAVAAQTGPAVIARMTTRMDFVVQAIEHLLLLEKALR